MEEYKIDKSNNYAIPTSRALKKIMVCFRVSVETKAVMDEARRVGKLKGYKVDLEAMLYDVHAKFIRDMS